MRAIGAGSVEPPETGAAQLNVNADDTTVRPARGNMKKKKSNKKLIIIIVAIAAVALIAVGVFVIRPLLTERSYPLLYKETITEMAKKYELDPTLVCAVIYTESAFDTDAESGAGARGLMQIMPDTGEWLSGKIKLDYYDSELLFEPEINIEMGCWYLSYLEKRFDGVQDTLLAAYNAGHGRVDEWLANPEYSSDGRTLSAIPYRETADYVKKVDKYYDIYKSLYDLGA